MDLEKIRKWWVLLGTTVMMIGLNNLPGWVGGIVDPTGTDLFFTFLGAGLNYLQFWKKRTGEDKTVAELNAKPVSKIVYAIVPWKAAA